MSDPKPIVIGLYGVPGSGKTHLMNHTLKKTFGNKCLYYDGSSVIAQVFEGGLPAFNNLPPSEKVSVRELAIQKIQTQCLSARKIGIVTGHLTLWNHPEPEPEYVFTTADFEVYDCIFYLDPSAATVFQQVKDDVGKVRGLMSLEGIQKHKDLEYGKLQELCYEFGVLQARIDPCAVNDGQILKMVDDVLRNLGDLRTEEENSEEVLRRLDGIVPVGVKNMFVIDGDKTLAPHDSGDMFWRKFPGSEGVLRKLFGSNMRYSYQAWRQASLLYETEVSSEKFERVCDAVANDITLYPEMESFLKEIVGSQDIGAVVVTCGLRRIWEKVLQRAGLFEHVKVIGAGRFDNGYVVSGETKARIVQHLQSKHDMKVCAIGDSKLDLPMLREADSGVVVVGEPALRSESMSEHLCCSGGMEALPQIDLEAVSKQKWSINLLHATGKTAARLLMTPMRDAKVSGRALQEAHRQVGRYLAIEYLADVIGLEQYDTLHVQNTITSGNRLAGEAKTVIVPLMRGGEPMAFGVHDTFPLASFLHASSPEDLKVDKLKDRETIILVDSVVNSGKSIAEFVNHIRKLRIAARVVVVAGVVQQESVAENGTLARALDGFGVLDVVALRQSANRYTGVGGTDTGNRLFNTTHLE
ncbi:uncharacterized protein MYCFIDRAFT_64502 [Pseudocercospora fijiensis CIRAD86]|uniref:Phosphoribosyltransferase domain-containing protein n=1 Tax=Pseudocercospora fijiensis (strain CIRAD86) TaxID=383855 RepID=M2YQ09_PSEFD|nr:uncharacterized protein MYCFIDRAFT_64502 [Pseudocercospora fijiensis CIRAD86]EME79800.1 hypothetical protein MYCFIDRAFT_64502 [Pseudocercospora fijiensis CIRAD86]